MANRFPLIVDSVNENIKELPSGDNLDLTGNDALFGDNDKAIFGAGSDLQIYHDPANGSIVKDNGTGRLLLDSENGTGISLTSGGIAKTMISATKDSDVKLYYDNATKLATTATGIDVTGTVTADGLTVDTNTLHVDAANNRVGIGETNPSTELEMSSNGTDGPTLRLSNQNLSIPAGGSHGTIEFFSGDASNPATQVVSSIKSIHPVTAPNYGELTFSSGSNIEAMRIDFSQRVLISTTSGRTDFSGADAVLQIEGTSLTTSSYAATRNTNDAYGPVAWLNKSRGTSDGAVTIVSASDTVGEIIFTGADGTQLHRLASITAIVDGTPGTNDMPGRLQFNTTADGATSTTERMRITEAGDVGIGTESPVSKLSVKTANIGSGSTNFATVALASVNPFAVADKIATMIGGYDTNIFGAAVGFSYTDPGYDMVFATNDNLTGNPIERMRINSSGQIIQGNTAAYSSNYSLFLENSYLTGQKRSIGNRYGEASSNGPTFDFLKTRSNNNASTSLVNNGDSLGEIRFFGMDGVDAERGAVIQARVDGTPGSNDMPGRLVFSTTADGASSSTERMRITEAGDVGIGVLVPQEKVAISTTGTSQDVVLQLLGTNSDTNQSNGVKLRAIGRDDNSGRGTLSIETRRSSLSYAEVARFDSDGRVLIGTESSRSNGNVQAQFQVEGLDGDSSSMSLTRNGADANPPYLVFAKSRGTADGAVTAVQDGDDIGRIRFAAADGTDTASRAAEILVEIDGTPGADDTPGRIIFETTADGAFSSTERMRIDRNGAVEIKNTAIGVNVNRPGLTNNVWVNVFTFDADWSGVWYISWYNDQAAITAPDAFGTLVVSKGRDSSNSFNIAELASFANFSFQFSGTTLQVRRSDGTGGAPQFRFLCYKVYPDTDVTQAPNEV